MASGKAALLKIELRVCQGLDSSCIAARRGMPECRPRANSEVCPNEASGAMDTLANESIKLCSRRVRKILTGIASENSGFCLR
jgi:hypothetical protein